MRSVQTAVFEIRCDLRVVAAIARYYAKHGVLSPTRSGLGRDIIEDFLVVLLKNGEATEIESTTEAAEILATLNLTGFNRSGRGHKNLAEQLKIEGGVETITDEDFMQSLFKRVKE